jgi:hypothetical protein
MHIAAAAIIFNQQAGHFVLSLSDVCQCKTPVKSFAGIYDYILTDEIKYSNRSCLPNSWQVENEVFALHADISYVI